MTCVVRTCDRPKVCRGYCDGHYRRVRQFGSAMAEIPLVKGAMQRKPPVIRTCEICGLSFTKKKHTSGRYCSRACASSRPDVVERIVRASRETAERRGDAQRGRGEGRTYRKLNGRHEHRVVAERKLGRALRPGEIVHHLDGNKLNNDPDNLAVMTQSEHIRLHKPRRPRKVAA